MKHAVVAGIQVFPLTTIIEVAITVIITLAVGLLLGYRLLHRVGDGSPALTGFVETEDAAADPSLVNGHSQSPTESTPDEHVPEVLTDEHRVIRMLEEKGGRMPQSRIVEETEWSKSKISRLLSKMEDQSQVEKISQGRENLIVLAGIEELNTE